MFGKKSTVPLFAGLVLCLFPLIGGAGPARGGELAGAPYRVWRPDHCAGFLWLHLPGYRPEDAPRVIAWEPREEPYRTLLDEGWTFATTLYRKNGWAVSEGQEDSLALMQRMIEDFGDFRLIIVEGESMGGLIATHLAESAVAAEKISGVLALGAALGLSPERLAALGAADGSERLREHPLRPVLFLSNRNELGGPLAYLAEVSAGDQHRFVSVHSVERPGHVNFSTGERSRAVRWIINWVSGEPPGRLEDGTVEPVLAVGGGELGEGRLVASVLRVDPVYGNLDLNVTLGDLEAMGLTYGSIVALEHGETKVFARVGDRYASVPEGDWVAVVLPDGSLRIAINQSNAGAALGISEGAPLALMPVL